MSWIFETKFALAGPMPIFVYGAHSRLLLPFLMSNLRRASGGNCWSWIRRDGGNCEKRQTNLVPGWRGEIAVILGVPSVGQQEASKFGTLPHLAGVKKRSQLQAVGVSKRP